MAKKPVDLTEYIRASGNHLLKREAEIAAALGEKERTIRTWRHGEIIPAIVLGHRRDTYQPPAEQGKSSGVSEPDGESFDTNGDDVRGASPAFR